MNTIALISHALGNKPETIVEGEVEGIRSRLSHEPVHYREDETNPICAKCLRMASVWLGSVERWEIHAAKCVTVQVNSVLNPIRSWRR